MPRRYDLELFLKQSELFGELSGPERKKLAAQAREQSFSKGQILFHEGKPSDSVWLTLEGRVHMLHHHSDGRTEASCVMTPGETFCCLPALDEGAYPATAVAATQCRVLRIPTALFHALMQKMPGFLKNTLCVFSKRLREIESRGCLVHDPVELRIARALIALQKKFGSVIPLTRQEIAELTGTTVETAIRTTRRFEKEGWIKTSRGKIGLLNPSALQQLTE